MYIYQFVGSHPFPGHAMVGRLTPEVVPTRYCLSCISVPSHRLALICELPIASLKNRVLSVLIPLLIPDFRNSISIHLPIDFKMVMIGFEGKIRKNRSSNVSKRLVFIAVPRPLCSHVTLSVYPIRVGHGIYTKMKLERSSCT